MTSMTFTGIPGMDRPVEGAEIRYGDTLFRVVSSQPLRDDDGRETCGFTLEVEPLNGG